MLNNKPIQTSRASTVIEKTKQVQNTYFGEVVSIDDENDGGRIKVKILGLDNNIKNISDLPDCYPLLPKFFHVLPKVGEMAIVFIADEEFPQKGRFYLGSYISQLQKIRFDSIFTSLSTTNIGYLQPQKAISTIPDASGVFPEKEDVALIGRVNTDIILKENQTQIRAGKHVNGTVLELNIKNPATVLLSFDKKQDSNEYYSNTIINSDKIAFISHEGNPQFKAARLTKKDRENIFNNSHPIARGDVLIKAMEIIRRAIISHIHGYSGVEADKNTIINDLEKINFEEILQKNIMIN